MGERMQGRDDKAGCLSSSSVVLDGNQRMRKGAGLSAGLCVDCRKEMPPDLAISPL